MEGRGRDIAAMVVVRIMDMMGKGIEDRGGQRRCPRGGAEEGEGVRAAM